MSDEKSRLARTYRDLDAADLLKLYTERNDLSPVALDALRDELKLRGLDPDSLRATVPKAEREDDEGEGGAELAEADASSDMPALPDVPEELAGEFDPGKNRVLCPTCGTDNDADDARCRACRAILPSGATMESPSVARPGAPAGSGEPATIASATFGLMGLAGLVFGVYVIVTDRVAFDLGMIASAVGAICLAVAITLYRRRGQRPGP